MFVHIRGGEGAKQRLTLYNESQASLLRNTIRDCVATKKAAPRFGFISLRNTIRDYVATKKGFRPSFFVFRPSFF